MFKWRVGLVAGSFGLAMGLTPTAGIGQEIHFARRSPLRQVEQVQSVLTDEES